MRPHPCTTYVNALAFLFMSRQRLPRGVKKDVQIQVRLTPAMATKVYKRAGQGQVSVWIRSLIEKELTSVTP